MNYVALALLAAAGGFLTYYSWWLLLHASDERVKSRVRFFKWPGTSREDEDAGREAEAAMAAVILMVIGGVLLTAGVVGIIGAVRGG